MGSRSSPALILDNLRVLKYERKLVRYLGGSGVGSEQSGAEHDESGYNGDGTDPEVGTVVLEVNQENCPELMVLEDDWIRRGEENCDDVETDAGEEKTVRTEVKLVLALEGVV